MNSNIASCLLRSLPESESRMLWSPILQKKEERDVSANCRPTGNIIVTHRLAQD